MITYMYSRYTTCDISELKPNVNVKGISYNDICEIMLN